MQPLAGFVRPDGDPDTDLETDGLATSSSSGKHNAVTSSHFGFLLVSQSARKQPDSPLKRVGFISFCSLHGAAGRRGGAVRGEGRGVGEDTRTGQKSGRPFHPRYCVTCFQSSIGWVVRSCHFFVCLYAVRQNATTSGMERRLLFFCTVGRGRNSGQPRSTSVALGSMEPHFHRISRLVVWV